ncbi:hypothetical protein ABID80_002523 [Streptomyces sp. PvP037]|uniref:hypothetical protein n=1 Tax=Streptomyces sp. PvP037 TaxID=3156437 RepID=UPI0033981BA2
MSRPGTTTEAPQAPAALLQVSPLLSRLERALAERHRTVRLHELPDPERFLRDHGGR